LWAACSAPAATGARAHRRAMVPLPVTLVVTCAGLPVQTMVPLPGTDACKVSVARVTIRPEPERTVCTLRAAS